MSDLGGEANSLDRLLADAEKRGREQALIECDARDVTCSCGITHRAVPKLQALRFARNHDDSPEGKHVVSSPQGWFG